MANVNKPRGFVRPISDDGTAPKVESYLVGQNTTLYRGQPVKMSSGRLVALASTADPIFGIMAQYVKTGAGETKSALVINPVNTTFELTSDATGGPVTDARAGLYFDLVNNTAGDAVTGESTCGLDASTYNATATGLAVQMERQSTRQGNDNTVANNCVRVRILRLQRGTVNS